MTYAEMIKENCERHSSVNWWPRYAYHDTDVANAISILSCGALYSRMQAENMGVMQNDNASRQVIDMTAPQTTAYVRFYFRPLTPTQYYNEGYKHKQLRYQGDRDANMPVPVFFLFDLETILRQKETRFSELGQAGRGSALRHGEEAFSQMPFDKIYGSGYADPEVRRFRHAEILYPRFFAIDNGLKAVYCRNECEKLTLLNLLREKNRQAYDKYKALIRVGQDDLFYRNGLFVDSVVFHEDAISFQFSDTPAKAEYIRRQLPKGAVLSGVEADFTFEWFHAKGRLEAAFSKATLSYARTGSILFRLPKVSGARVMRATVEIEGKTMCVYEQPLSSFELV